MHTVVIHQHLYQPPREEPWLEVVPMEPSAAPDHDWNMRITRECYARLAAAPVHHRDARAAVRDPDARRGMSRLVNLYAWCSFDVGPTLAEWLAQSAPQVLAAMQAGDAASVARWGHGNALASPYHHVILPLASPRERRTEIRWGIRDFIRRFGRAPEGFWFPECAVDEASLDAVAAEGIAFTILAPYQVHGAEGAPQQHGHPVTWRGAQGRTLRILPYDGALAGDVAFGGLLRDPEALAHRLAGDADGHAEHVTTLATDGETFGHHHPRGDAVLADALATLAQWPTARLLNAATVVATAMSTRDVTLVSPSAWSCAHGVERWRSNCGCRLDGHREPAQQWRGPLREALEALATRADAVFEEEGRAIFTTDPWEVRDRYGDVVCEDGEVLDQFVRAQLSADASALTVVRGRELLELSRATLRMFTSCAWFFDEVDRIEVRQVLRYAARVLDLSGHAARWTPDVVQALSRATSGQPGARSAGELFVREALPHRDPAVAVAAAAMALAAQGTAVSRIAAFDLEVHPHAAGWQVQSEHRRTGTLGRWIGVVSGSGPSIQVRLGAPDAAPGAWDLLAIHDLPERQADQLLRGMADRDDALLG